MDRRVAQGRSQGSGAVGRASTQQSDVTSARLLSIGIGLGLVAIALTVYSLTRPYRFYDHFEWQAQAFLEGKAAIRYPVEATPDSPGNAFFQDVLPVASDDGVPRGLIPFPPLPAVVLMPFVALWGRHTDGQLIFAALGAIDVGLAWWMLGRLPIRLWVRLATTIFLGFGTVFWYAAQIGTTWYQAHVVAVGLVILAIGIALGADPGAALDEAPGPVERDKRESRFGSSAVGRVIAELGVDRRQFLAGLVFGLACTARLTVVFGAPFFLLVGGGATLLRRGLSSVLGAALPIGGLLIYNLVSSGHIFHPGYQYLYELEAGFYTPLHYNLAWAIEDPRYIPQNLGIMLFGAPAIAPDVVPSALGGGQALCVTPGAVRGLFDPACPIALPRDTGMSVILTSPAYLLGLPALRRYARNRVVLGAALAVVAIGLVNLMHFSQGWVQFGYRFSNDFVPWALLLVAIGLERIRSRTGIAIAIALLGLSVAVNLWGVVWGNALGW